MKPFVRILLFLLCGASAAAQRLHRPQVSAGKFGDQTPDRPEVPESADVLQEKQSLHDPLSWRYPDPPAEEEPRFPPDFKPEAPAAADSVRAVCGENSVRVEVKRDLLGIGKPVRAQDVTLGGCPAIGEDDEAQVLVFESELHQCGSQLEESEDFLVYVFALIYTPSPLGDGQIVRTTEATVAIECHYPRRQNVSSWSLKPTWTPFSGTKASEESLHFSIKLMTDDWQFPRPSSRFHLGDMMRFEVSVEQFHHIPLRVMVDSCVATVVPNIDTVPRYTFLGHNGCMFDAKMTGSSSKFLPRSQDDKLQFELESFMFQQDHGDMIYVTCSLRATPAAAAIDATNKACSFSNGWREASGSHRACACCDTNCGTGSRSLLTGTRPEWEQESTVGPIAVKERLA